MRRVLPIALFLFLLIPASATAAIPGIKDTKPYKNLRTYVLFLEGVDEATADQKKKYANTLSARIQRAESQVTQLRERREAKTNKNYKALLRKRYGVVNDRFAKRERAARRESRAKEEDARQVWQRTKRSIRSSYGRQLRPLEKRVRKLRRQLRQSQNAREQALLADEIIILRREIANIREEISKDISRARRDWKAQERAIKKRLKRELRILSRQRDIERDETRRAWNSERQVALGAVGEKRRIEAALVRELRIRGGENLDAIIVVEAQ